MEPKRHDPILECLNGAIQQVGQLNDGFRDVGSNQRHSLAALAQQEQQVSLRLRALGVLPGQAGLSSRLTQEFDGSYRKAMQARLAVALAPDDPMAALAAAQPFFYELQNDLQQEYMNAQERWLDSAYARSNSMRRAVVIIAASVVLVAAGLAFLIWRLARHRASIGLPLVAPR